MFAGTAGYELGSGYTNSMHTSLVDNSCVDCHMAEAYGVEAGGHVMSASYTNYGSTTYLTDGCTDCHSDVSALETKIENTKLEIEGLVDSLETKLIADGLLDAASHRVVPGAYTNDQAGAVYNYIFVAKDGSYGMHNYEYAKKLLQNSLAALK
jgi:formate-dependent nitrite reductase cytochrome c552 subunit